MTLCLLRFPDAFPARARRGEIRWQLFLCREVRDVLPTSRPDTLHVVFDGPVRLDRWTAALAQEGLPVPTLVPGSVVRARTATPDRGG
ncbi:hypothetical protein GKE82_12640 [Conexibacter sp. W3-3-2]|uniref:hypothetical protein n=1 Tax=Conexibacter sp. W3-3-2 TaxID=2675227 RepID=UPI0012B7C053|nr:hypothetical protein [Conexibacter sp. W3-3-2]MTD45116.1 hypothetical protein [Conexibacter sp. W3-3-2]